MSYRKSINRFRVAYLAGITLCSSACLGVGPEQEQDLGAIFATAEEEEPYAGGPDGLGGGDFTNCTERPRFELFSAVYYQSRRVYVVDFEYDIDCLIANTRRFTRELDLRAYASDLTLETTGNFEKIPLATFREHRRGRILGIYAGGDHGAVREREEVQVATLDGNIDRRSTRIRLQYATEDELPILEFLPGDLTGEGVVDADDIDLLARSLRFHSLIGGSSVAVPRSDQIDNVADVTRRFSYHSPVPFENFDLNGDGYLDLADRDYGIETIHGSTYGDANLDGIFDSTDFIQVFQAATFEDTTPLNSGWASGDWDGNGEFDTADFVLAFTAGGYVSDVLDAP